eukprot:TRINITY_DN1033_c0_g1_i2.p1 TRINITY_DN1033_c0_g1~~TRINITY_DN1033_c0_g1_i2.p1  ORF type:complete len:157 (-),score=38.01 TRINITY_DN1033_c0_g1_i2:83-553(-)
MCIRDRYQRRVRGRNTPFNVSLTTFKYFEFYVKGAEQFREVLLGIDSQVRASNGSNVDPTPGVNFLIDFTMIDNTIINGRNWTRVRVPLSILFGQASSSTAVIPLISITLFQWDGWMQKTATVFYLDQVRLVSETNNLYPAATGPTTAVPYNSTIC